MTAPPVSPEEIALWKEADEIGHHIAAEYERLAEIRAALAALRQDPFDG